jgi:hypothetical protein
MPDSRRSQGRRPNIRRLTDRPANSQAAVMIRALLDQFGPAPIIEAIARYVREAAVGRGHDATRTAKAIERELEDFAARLRELNAMNAR